jgi:hypothetical protein
VSSHGLGFDFATLTFRHTSSIIARKSFIIAYIYIRMLFFANSTLYSQIDVDNDL